MEEDGGWRGQVGKEMLDGEAGIGRDSRGHGLKDASKQMVDVQRVPED